MNNNDDFDVVLCCDPKEFNDKVDFYELLTEDMKKELGEINSSWFDEAFNDASSSPVTQRDDVLDLQNDVSDLRNESFAEKSIDYSESNEVVIEKKDCQKLHATLANDVTPSLVSPVQFVWSPLTRGSQTMLSNRFHSTPGYIALSLGASIGGHEMSWTSSMATPYMSYMTNSKTEERDEISKNTSKVVVDYSCDQSKTDTTPVSNSCKEVSLFKVTKSLEEDHNITLPKFSNSDNGADLPKSGLFDPKLSSNENCIRENISGTTLTHVCNEHETNESTDWIERDQREVYTSMTTPKLRNRNKIKRRRMIDADNVKKDQHEEHSAQSEMAVSQLSPKYDRNVTDVIVGAERCDAANNVDCFSNDHLESERKAPFSESENCDSQKLVRVSSDHDYAKTVTLSKQCTNIETFKIKKESNDDYDSHKMNDFTQIMEVVDSTVALFEDMKNEMFTQMSPNKKTSHVEDVLVASSNRGTATEEHNVPNEISKGKSKITDVVTNENPLTPLGCLDTCSKIEKSTPKDKPQLPKAVETQDYLFWDPDFPESGQCNTYTAVGPSSPLLVYENDFFDDESDFDVTPTCNANLPVTQKGVVELEIESKMPMPMLEKDMEANKETGNLESFPGLVAASVTAVNVTEKSLINTRKVYNDLLEEGKFEKTLSDVFSVKHLTVDAGCLAFKGFSTASGKPLRISEESLKKAKQLHYEEIGKFDFDCDVAEIQLCSTSENTEKQLGRNLGATVSVESVGNMDSNEPLIPEPQVTNIVERAISPAVEDLSVMIKTENISALPLIFSKLNGTTVGCGVFTTASGKNVSISKKALERAKLLHLEDLNQMVKGETTADISVSKGLQKSYKSGSFFGFSTASGKPCTVSNESLEKAQKLYESHVIQIENEEFGAGDGNVNVAKRHCAHSPVMGNLESNTRGIKRLLNEKTDERPTKFTFRSCAHKVIDISPTKTINSSVDNTKLNTKRTNEISEDSMDAAEALIAMANCDFDVGEFSSCGNGHSTPNVSTVATPFKLANEKPVRVSSQSFEHVTRLEQTITTGDNSTICFDASKSNNYLSIELEESTAALLEDEFEVSNKDCNGEATIESSFDNSTKKRSRKNDRCRSDTETPVSTANASWANFKQISCDSALAGGEEITAMKNMKDCNNAVLLATECSAEILKKRKIAIEEQQLRVAQKSTQRIVPVTGELYKKKSEKYNRISLKKFLGSDIPRRISNKDALKCGIKRSTLAVRSWNAKDFLFSLSEHFTHFSKPEVGIFQLEDGAVLILNECNDAGKEEFYRSLVDCPGVEPKLINKDWVFNHYRWIVWKLAAYEVAFPHIFAGRCLTPARVMSELRYRVNREIDFSQSSALKRITERDDTSMKTMILCVARIICEDTENCTGNLISLEVTDGWYSVIAVLDKPLSALVKRRKIIVGQKLIVHGAEIISSAEACPPLEVPKGPLLRFSYNSCRLARFDAKLGFFHSPRPFPLPLSCLSLDGGVVSRVDVIIARVYPLQFFEKLHNGSFVVYNTKTNELADRGNENEKSDIMDRLLTDVQTKLEQEESKQGRKHNVFGTRSYTRENVLSLCEGEELAEAMQSVADPGFFESCLSATQKSTLIAYNERLSERRQARLQSQLSKAIQMRQEKGELPAERNVVPFLKVRAIGIHEKDRQSNTTCTVSIWRPSEDLKCIIEEGKCMQIYYLAAEHRSYGRELGLKTVKMTKFEEISSDNNVTSSLYVKRKFTTFSEISSQEFCPAYGDVDIVGVVVSTGNLDSQPGSKFEISYFANYNRDIIGIKFWGGRKAFGCDSVLEPGSFIAAHNLQWRGREKSVIPCVHASELSLFTSCPKDQETKHILDVLKNSIADLQSFLLQCKEKVTNILHSDSLSPTVSLMQRHGIPKFTSTPLSNRSNFGTPTTLRVRSDPILCKMKQLQSLSGVVPQLIALPSPNSPSVCSKYKVPFSRGSAKM